MVKSIYHLLLFQLNGVSMIHVSDDMKCVLLCIGVFLQWSQAIAVCFCSLSEKNMMSLTNNQVPWFYYYVFWKCSANAMCISWYTPVVQYSGMFVYYGIGITYSLSNDTTTVLLGKNVYYDFIGYNRLEIFDWQTNCFWSAMQRLKCANKQGLPVWRLIWDQRFRLLLSLSAVAPPYWTGHKHNKRMRSHLSVDFNTSWL